MATSTDVPIYTTTLTSTTTSVVMDISQFQGYKNLKIVYSAQNSGGSGAVLGMRFNSDTGSNYSATYGYGTGSTYASGGEANQSGMSGGDVPSESSGLFSANIIYVNNYSNTNMYKTAVMRHNAPGVVTVMSTGMWRSTAAITSITFYGATFTVGSTFSVYGIGSASLGAKATGGAIYSDANYFYHVFGSTGAFTPTQSLAADILIVAGGGGGGANMGGGGGAGGVNYFASQSLTTTSYTCTVGAGGAFGTDNAVRGVSGANSQFGALTASVGGGGGGSLANAYRNGLSGGSGGGGAGGYDLGTGGTGGTATSGQGYAGGNGASGSNGQNLAGAGGGGSGAAGGNGSGYGSSSVGGTGGVGLSTYSSWGLATGIGEIISGTYYIAGGGGGGIHSTSTSIGVGGYGGGGNCGIYNSIPAEKGMANTGSGGGGGTNGVDAANGGSGVVIVRYAK